MKRDALVIKDRDNIATAITDIQAGADAVVGIGEDAVTVRVSENIALGHKFAVTDIEVGADVFKYNCVIGRATRDIKKGEHAHVHNMESLRGRGDL
ncbi:UxaA family hydrolase [Desulfospira joergensenii]|uniref:UxaA family hydrolase n=1 Tax=Desulfospira joergensenii TaxID=53329 RepID=UPI0003B56AA4|nr:UxaA family hydrolase [Desulfospira joergensenii]